MRIVAFLMLLYGAYGLAFSMLQANGLIEKPVYTTAEHVVGGIVFLGLGFLVMVFAERITNVAYPPERTRRDD